MIATEKWEEEKKSKGNEPKDREPIGDGIART